MMTSPAATPGTCTGFLPAATLRDAGAVAPPGRHRAPLPARPAPEPPLLSGTWGPRRAPVDPRTLARVKAALERL
jgi:hypothetical protein